ncbi:hypothetical protein [uncultured Litoreibacter sp.]|uniref:hypothetical protein n=1 Tax=uncultured Litoreibacter sp. TaxID=1392394 RepID=UPI00260985E4|nr:hypothetical protein [uncultured Litoreibacter sp.]
MTENQAKPDPDWKTNEPFPDDIAAVEQGWDLTIPPDYTIIGGVDEFGWVFLKPTDRVGFFEGEYLDARLRYRGLWRYEHPDGKVAPEDVLGTYFISSYTLGEGLFIRPLGEFEPPVPYAYLVPVVPEDVQSAYERDLATEPASQ